MACGKLAPLSRKADLDAIYQHIARQESLCAEIRFLNHELETQERKLASELNLDISTRGMGASSGQLDPESTQHLRMLLGELTAIQSDVQHLNRVLAELLRRSRRTINILINCSGSHTGTYRPPVPAIAPASRERVVK